MVWGGGTTGKNGKGKADSDFRGVFPGKDRETIWGDFEIFCGKNRETRPYFSRKKNFWEKSGDNMGFRKGSL